MKTLFVGQNAIHLKAVDSTNSYATEMLRQIAPNEGTIIYTFDQTKGRGQRGNNWLSEANKNVALSLVLHPHFLHTEEQILLTKIASLATTDLMAEILLDKGIEAEIKIKWPNDIYLNNDKIVGILIENTIRDNRIQYSILGIGMNINQTLFPTDIHATSLKSITNAEFDLNKIIARWCEFMEARYLQLKTKKTELIDKDYLQQLYRLGEWKNYHSNGVAFEGKIVGVSSFGKLQMELRNTELKEFDLKEIVFL